MAVFMWETVKVCVCCIVGFSLCFFLCGYWLSFGFSSDGKETEGVWSPQKLREAAFAAGNIFVGCEETVQRLFHDLLLFNCPCLTQRNTYLSSKMMSKCVSRWYTVSFPLMIIVEVGAFTHCISFTLMMVVWLGGVAVWPFQLMTFGFFLCVDAFLYVFTLLPLRVLLAVLRLLTLPCCGFRSEPKHTLSYL